jgi:hypothetical protein
MSISISFTNEIFETESVALFSHNSGEMLINSATNYLEMLQKLLKDNKIWAATPLARLEPEILMVDFLHYFRSSLKRITNNYFLGKDEFDGDNSDYGHHKIEVTAYYPSKEYYKKIKDMENHLKKGELVPKLIYHQINTGLKELNLLT